MWVDLDLKSFDRIESCFTRSTYFYSDNIRGYKAKHPVFDAHTKHIEIDIHFIRERSLLVPFMWNTLALQKKIADIMTKALPSSKFVELRTKLTILPIPWAYVRVLDPSLVRRLLST